MHTSLRFTLSLTVVLVASSAPPTSAQVKFEEQTLAEDVTNATATVSPRGVHVAAVIPKGSRQAVVYDGIEGPRFDAIATPGFFTFDGLGGSSKPMYDGTGTINVRTLGPRLSGPTSPSQILFNSQGTHVAYVGRSGTEFALILDGKEVHRSEYHGFRFIAFAPGGERLVAIATGKDMGPDRVIIDGKPGPPGISSEIFFTPDGAHYAYAGKNNDPQQTPWMVVDGRQVKHVGEIVGFASTGTLFTRAFANYNHILLANGKPMAQASDFNILALQGTRLVLQATPPLGTPPRKQPTVLTVDGKVVPGAEDVSVRGTWFSPDGKRYAVLCQRSSPQQETFMIVDGKKELSYQNIFNTKPYTPSFSPDSTKLAYLAQSASGTFLVMDGEESDALQSATFPTWSSTGSRYAWNGLTTASKQVFYIDGKSTPLPPNTSPNYFQFSPDGAHTSWSYGRSSTQTLVVDGSPVDDVDGQTFLGAPAIDGQDAIIKFSPDGKHVAYAGRDSKNNSRQGLWVDGKLITPLTTPQVNRVTFTPDSQHVAWAVSGLRDNQGGYRIFVDGREVLAYNSSAADNTAGAWEMGDDGTLTFLGADGSSLKRYRIPPPLDSSIATMLAAAK
jgi:hypothetical protein